jgi:hypothetical protein
MQHQTDIANRPSALRTLAVAAATHPRIEQAVLGAIRSVLPSVLEQLIAEEAERQGGGRARLYGRKATSEARELRDQRVLSLLESGMAPELIALESKCSRSHVFAVRAKWRDNKTLAKAQKT